MRCSPWWYGVVDKWERDGEQVICAWTSTSPVLGRKHDITYITASRVSAPGVVNHVKGLPHVTPVIVDCIFRISRCPQLEAHSKHWVVRAARPLSTDSRALGALPVLRALQ